MVQAHGIIGSLTKRTANAKSLFMIATKRVRQAETNADKVAGGGARGAGNRKQESDGKIRSVMI